MRFLYLLMSYQKSLKLNYFHSIKLAEKRQNAATSSHIQCSIEFSWAKIVAILLFFFQISMFVEAEIGKIKSCDLQGRGRRRAIIHEFAMQKRRH